MTMAVDLELKKAFQDLSLKMVATREKVSDIERQYEAAKRLTARAQITSKTLGSLAPDHKTWESHGRIFVLRPRDELATKLVAQIKDGEEKMKTLETSKTYHETKFKESENNIREMITAKQNAVK